MQILNLGPEPEHLNLGPGCRDPWPENIPQPIIRSPVSLWSD